MAGTNLVLQAGQMLFQQGEASNGMYILRQGELVVFLKNDDKEVVLAKVTTGAMIGEMALFDQKPRSASVKAVVKCEVTLISLDDFNKLMKQIPKWFTALMITLSGRLRETNERLQKIEGASSSSAPQGLSALKRGLRFVTILDVLFNRDGEKEGKVWALDRKTCVANMRDQFCEEEKCIQECLNVFLKSKIFGLGKNSYNSETLTLPNRGQFTKLQKIFSQFLSFKPAGPLEEGGLEMLQGLTLVAEKSGYEAFQATLEELEKLTTKFPHVNTWKSQLKLMQALEPSVKTTVDPKGAATFRANKKEIADVYSSHQLINALYKAIRSS